MTDYHVLDLFCGLGGFSEAIRDACERALDGDTHTQQSLSEVSP